MSNSNQEESRALPSIKSLHFVEEVQRPHDSMAYAEAVVSTDVSALEEELAEYLSGPEAFQKQKLDSAKYPQGKLAVHDLIHNQPASEHKSYTRIEPLQVDPSQLENVESNRVYKMRLANKELYGCNVEIAKDMDVFSFQELRKKMKNMDMSHQLAIPENSSCWTLEINVLAGNSKIKNCNVCETWRDKTSKAILVLTNGGNRVLQFREDPFIHIIIRCSPKGHCWKPLKLQFSLRRTNRTTYTAIVPVFKRTRKRKSENEETVSLREVSPSESSNSPPSSPLQQKQHQDNISPSNKRMSISMLNSPTSEVHTHELHHPHAITTTTTSTTHHLHQDEELSNHRQTKYPQVPQETFMQLPNYIEELIITRPNESRVFVKVYDVPFRVPTYELQLLSPTRSMYSCIYPCDPQPVLRVTRTSPESLDENNLFVLASVNSPHKYRIINNICSVVGGIAKFEGLQLKELSSEHLSFSFSLFWGKKLDDSTYGMCKKLAVLTESKYWKVVDQPTDIEILSVYTNASIPVNNVQVACIGVDINKPVCLFLGTRRQLVHPMQLMHSATGVTVVPATVVSTEPLKIRVSQQAEDIALRVLPPMTNGSFPTFPLLNNSMNSTPSAMPQFPPPQRFLTQQQSQGIAPTHTAPSPSFKTTSMHTESHATMSTTSTTTTSHETQQANPLSIVSNSVFIKQQPNS